MRIFATIGAGDYTGRVDLATDSLAVVLIDDGFTESAVEPLEVLHAVAVDLRGLVDWEGLRRCCSGFRGCAPADRTPGARYRGVRRNCATTDQRVNKRKTWLKSLNQI